VAVPGLLAGDLVPSPARDVDAHATREQDGFVWVWGEAGTTPVGEPFGLPNFDGRKTGEVVFESDLDCTMHAAIENALDVPHTAFLHQGLFRGGEPRPITAVRNDVPDGVEVQYVGEPVAFGRLNASWANLTFDHWDRFFLPSIAQIEYGVTGWVHLVNTILHLPMSPFRTRAWFVVRFWTRLPTVMAHPVVAVRGRQILRQDARALARQSDNVRRFGRERYTSTDLDLLGNAVWRLLREAERQESGEDEDSPTGSDDTGPTRPSVIFRI
jgi:phenylpropionate dioxygenase-like ring-hydroxylating dioxygenase large terminal subunit